MALLLLRPAWLVQVQGRGGLQAKWEPWDAEVGHPPRPGTWEELRSALLGADWLCRYCYCHVFCFQGEVYGFLLGVKGACSSVTPRALF